jgi:hypothetical protein
MEVICFSEMLLNFRWTTRRYAPENRTLYKTAVRTSNLNSFFSKISKILSRDSATIDGVLVGNRLYWTL